MEGALERAAAAQGATAASTAAALLKHALLEPSDACVDRPEDSCLRSFWLNARVREAAKEANRDALDCSRAFAAATITV